MFPDKQKYREAAHVGEELLDEESNDLAMKCLSIQKGLELKLFSIDAALRVYGVTRGQYDEFLGEDVSNRIDLYLSTSSADLKSESYIIIMKNLLNHFSLFQPTIQIDSVIRALGKVSKAVQKKELHHEE